MPMAAKARYSLGGLIRRAVTGDTSWPPAWRKASPRASYDVVIIGGGAHGLAIAYNLARRHGIRDVLVIERGWIGGGNTARNTTIIRSDYFLQASGDLKESALKLWEGLSRELNYNLMVSQRGYVDLAHSDGELEAFTLRANAMRLRGTDASILDRGALARRVPQLDLSPDARFPVAGALVQERGGTVRHDAVAWGYARAASALGVDIVEGSAVTGIEVTNGRFTGVQITGGRIAAGRAVIAVAGHSSEVARMAGIDLPLESIAVQAFVTEPVKPVLDVVVNYNAGLCYVSQTDKGEVVIGGGTEGYNSYAARGSFARIEDAARRGIAMFPFLSKMRLMRQWGGTADIAMDGNAIMGESPVEGLWLNAGWGYAGFKATPAVGRAIAASLANGRADPLIAPFALEQFATGALIDDAGAGPRPYAH